MDYPYNERHDAHYAPVEDEWLEETCNDPTCEFCPGRPAKPSLLDKENDEDN